jgi:hypothetical protein
MWVAFWELRAAMFVFCCYLNCATFPFLILSDTEESDYNFDAAIFQSRCEAILRTQPSARFAKELHLASMEAEEEQKREQLKQAAIGSVAAAVAFGAIGVVGVLLASKRK